MMYYTPVVLVSENKKVKKEIPSPRAETLMLIRHFARTYEYNPGQNQKTGRFLLN